MGKPHNRKPWRRRLAIATLGAVLAGSLGGGFVYWQYFRKDPQFLEDKRQGDVVQHELDDLFADESPVESTDPPTL